MPLYAWKCAHGHEFEQQSRMDGSDAPAVCPIFVDRDDPTKKCGASLVKLVTAPSRVFPGADSWRRG